MMDPYFLVHFISTFRGALNEAIYETISEQIQGETFKNVI